jgi:hypothetical protein
MNINNIINTSLIFEKNLKNQQKCLFKQDISDIDPILLYSYHEYSLQLNMFMSYTWCKNNFGNEIILYDNISICSKITQLYITTRKIRNKFTPLTSYVLDTAIAINDAIDIYSIKASNDNLENITSSKFFSGKINILYPLFMRFVDYQKENITYSKFLYILIQSFYPIIFKLFKLKNLEQDYTQLINSFSNFKSYINPSNIQNIYKNSIFNEKISQTLFLIGNKNKFLKSLPLELIKLILDFTLEYPSPQDKFLKYSICQSFGLYKIRYFHMFIECLKEMSYKKKIYNNQLYIILNTFLNQSQQKFFSIGKEYSQTHIIRICLLHSH